MVFKNFRINIISRILLLSLTIFVFFGLVNKGSFSAVLISIIILIFFQIRSLIRFLEKTNNELIKFLNSIRYDDFSISFQTKESGSTFNELYNEFGKVLKKFQELRAEKEANSHYFKTIVQHLGIGVLTFKRNGEVQMINTAAKRLLKVNRLKFINELEPLSAKLVTTFKTLKTGGRDLIKISKNGETIQLAIYAIELILQGEEFKLISIQNIQSELEEKEMEAWQNLIRVLTHEIMNSVTPISSLAATAGLEIQHSLESSQNDTCEINKEDLEDVHLAVETIKKRSLGLINFVNDFRSLSHIPTPKIKLFKVRELFDQIYLLMKAELDENNVAIVVKVEPETLSLAADPDLIEQVLINLIKNAVQALQDREDKKINLIAGVNSGSRVIIDVIDNGPGITEEALDKIFIPFFTTKKTGSGIGLSLSRQIMRQHKGTINVISKNNVGAIFTLVF